MENQVLSIEQMLELEELGIDISKASMCWRWQDWNTVKYDPQSTWDLNFEDYVDSTR